MELDPAVIGELVDGIGAAPVTADRPVRVGPTEAEVADTALRVLRLPDRPGALAVLGSPLVRELHFWLLSGRHGGAVRALGVAGGHASRGPSRCSATAMPSRCGSRRWPARRA